MTIEERAKDYAPDAFDADYILPAREGYIVKVQRDAYIAGATEQLHLDEQFYTSEMMQKERELRQTIERAKDYLRTLFAPSELTELMCEKMEQYIRNIPPK